MKNRIVLVLTALALLCGTVSAGDDTVLAEIGNDRITRADLDRIISYFDAEKQKAFEQNPENKAMLLKRLVQTRVIAKIAREKGFDRNPEIKEQLDMTTNEFLSREYIRKEVVGKIEITEEEMSVYYKINRDKFKIPEMVRARQILIKVDASASEEEKKKAREKADDLLKRIKAGEDFAKLASEYSEDKVSKAKGGDLGFIYKGKMVPEFDKELFALPVGGVSGIVESKFGYHIIKVEEKKESAVAPYDKAKDKVREAIVREREGAKVSEFIQQSLKESGAVIHTELLKDNKKQ